MKQTKAPKPTPTPTPGVADSHSSSVGTVSSPSAVFVRMGLDMSWRLAIVVLVPIIGGFELDKALNTSPVLICIGFVLAMAGTGLVMWRTLQLANHQPITKQQEKHS